MSLSGRTKNIMQIALADRVAGNELAAAVDAASWVVTAKEVAASTSASSAFQKKLCKGDIVEQVIATSGLTKFATVTATGTMPTMTITAGDLLTLNHPTVAQPQQIIFPDASEAYDNGGVTPPYYKDADPVNDQPVDPEHPTYPTP